MVSDPDPIRLLPPRACEKSPLWLFCRQNFEPITAANHFFRNAERQWSQQTRRQYAYILADWLRYCALAGVDPINADQPAVQYYCDLALRDDRVNSNTLNQRVGVVTHYFTFLANARYRLGVPFVLVRKRVTTGILAGTVSREISTSVGLKRRPERRQHPRYCVRNDLIDFIKSLRSTRDSLLARIMYSVGLRLSEAVEIRIDDLPPDLAGYIRNKRSYLLEVCGKRQKTRQVTIPAGILQLISDYLSVRPKTDAKALFVSLDRRGIPVTAGGISKAFLRHARETKLNITAHKFRHGFALERLIYWTAYYERRANQSAKNDDRKIFTPSYQAIKRVSTELGHESVSTTEIYLKFLATYQADINQDHINFMKQIFGEES